MESSPPASPAEILLCHHENYLFSISKIIFSGSKYPKNVLFNFAKGSTGRDNTVKPLHALNMLAVRWCCTQDAWRKKCKMIMPRCSQSTVLATPTLDQISEDVIWIGLMVFSWMVRTLTIRVILGDLIATTYVAWAAESEGYSPRDVASADGQCCRVAYCWLLSEALEGWQPCTCVWAVAAAGAVVVAARCTGLTQWFVRTPGESCVGKMVLSLDCFREALACGVPTHAIVAVRVGAALVWHAMPYVLPRRAQHPQRRVVVKHGRLFSWSMDAPKLVAEWSGLAGPTWACTWVGGWTVDLDSAPMLSSQPKYWLSHAKNNICSLSKKHILWIRVSKKYFIWFWKRKHCSAHALMTR